jgi:hypothetical protein
MPINPDDMNSYLISNYLRAEDLEENVTIESTIVEGTQTFEERGRSITRPIVYLEDGRAVVLNQTRLKVMLTAHGRERSNWIGKTIKIRRGQTFYEGKQVPAVEIQPVLLRLTR